MEKRWGKGGRELSREMLRLQKREEEGRRFHRS
jgi:hypothetical protein